jgi:hypothetical protein
MEPDPDPEFESRIFYFLLRKFEEEKNAAEIFYVFF